MNKSKVKSLVDAGLLDEKELTPEQKQVIENDISDEEIATIIRVGQRVIGNPAAIGKKVGCKFRQFADFGDAIVGGFRRPRCFHRHRLRVQATTVTTSIASASVTVPRTTVIMRISVITHPLPPAATRSRIAR